MDRADAVMVEGRRSLLELRSTERTMPTLPEQLSRVIAEIKLENGASCELQVHGRVRKLKPVVNMEILAIAREALINASRHSHASSIIAELSFNDDRLSFACCDNGVGMPASVLRQGSAEGHWGLVGMRERANKIGARLRLEQAKPCGTLVKIEISARQAYLRSSSEILKPMRQFYRWLLNGSEELQILDLCADRKHYLSSSIDCFSNIIQSRIMIHTKHCAGTPSFLLQWA